MWKAVLFTAGVLSSSLSLADTDFVQQEAEGAVRDNLLNAELKSVCSTLAEQARYDISKRKSAIASCDNDFVVSEGLTFSEMTTFTGKTGKHVCGIVSGKTAISKIGARFVYDSKDKRINLKYSKYPFLYSANTDFYRKSVIIQNNMYEMAKDLSCK